MFVCLKFLEFPQQLSDRARVIIFLVFLIYRVLYLVYLKIPMSYLGMYCLAKGRRVLFVNAQSNV